MNKYFNNCVIFQDLKEAEIEWVQFVDHDNFIFGITGVCNFYFGRVDGRFYNYFSVCCPNGATIHDKCLAREIFSVYINGVRYDWEDEDDDDE
jgi:hypothetical protein